MKSSEQGLLDPAAVTQMVDSVAREWGANIARLRTLRKWDQATLAGLVGVTETSIRRFECGRQVPRDRTRWAIAVALSTDVAKLFPAPSRERIESARDLQAASG